MGLSLLRLTSDEKSVKFASVSQSIHRTCCWEWLRGQLLFHLDALRNSSSGNFFASGPNQTHLNTARQQQKKMEIEDANVFVLEDAKANKAEVNESLSVESAARPKRARRGGGGGSRKLCFFVCSEEEFFQRLITFRALVSSSPTFSAPHPPQANKKSSQTSPWLFELLMFPFFLLSRHCCVSSEFVAMAHDWD